MTAQNGPLLGIIGAICFLNLHESSGLIEVTSDGVSLESPCIQRPEPLALLAWVMAHGVSKLAISGHLPFGLKGILTFNDHVSETLLRGMQK